MEQKIEALVVLDETPLVSQLRRVPSRFAVKRSRVRAQFYVASLIRRQPDVKDPAYHLIIRDITVTNGRTREFT